MTGERAPRHYPSSSGSEPSTQSSVVGSGHFGLQLAPTTLEASLKFGWAEPIRQETGSTARQVAR